MAQSIKQVLWIAALTGVAASLGCSPGGGSTAPFTKTLVLTVTEGPRTPADGNVSCSESGVVIQQIRLQSDPWEDLKVDAIYFRFEGTGSSQALASIDLVHDVDGNGAWSSTPDSLLGTSGNEGPYFLFSELNIVLDAGACQDWILVYTFNGSDPGGNTFSATFPGLGAIDAGGTESTLPLRIDAASMNGRTVTTLAVGSLALAPGFANPASGNIGGSEVNHLMLHGSLSAGPIEDVTITKATFTHLGTGSVSNAVANVMLVGDDNQNGMFDGAPIDTLLGVITPTSAHLVFEFGGVAVPASGSRSWLLFYTYSGTAAPGDSFQAAVLSGADIEAAGDGTGYPITPSGAPVLGGLQTVPPGTDTTPPAAISDLSAASGSSAGTADLTWTATGDDGNAGTATAYIVKMSTAPITASNFDAATTFVQGWAPQPAGTTENRTVSGLTQGQTNFFAIKVLDEVPNTSPMSNVAQLAPPTFGGVTAIASGDWHTIALKSDGKLWMWGNNRNGQLGDGTTTDRYRPGLVPGLTNVAAAEGGGEFTLALKNDGTVWGWGENAYGQLGDGTTTQRITPVQMPGLTGVTAIAAGARFTMALKSDGTVWTCGENLFGQLGDGTQVNRSIPGQVPGLTGVTAIAAGGYMAVVLKSDGTVWMWGNNFFGQLGDGTTTNQTLPVKVLGLSNVIAVSAGACHAQAVKIDGSGWAWGWNAYGQLGDGTTTDRHTPVQIAGLLGIVSLDGGSYHSVGKKNDGTAWAWGWNHYGQLGDGTTTDQHTPNQVPGLSGLTAVVSGSSAKSCALRNDATMWTWGENAAGQLGDGTTTHRYSPIQVQ
ncbi:MAG: RCC1 domain-containing protein [Planctomycetota bacterium]|jgi:alpha-tubulin suppressor-like RCC1 family protein